MPLFPEQFTASYFCLVVDGTKRLDYSVSRKAYNSCLPSTRRNQFVNVCANGKQLKMPEVKFRSDFLFTIYLGTYLSPSPPPPPPIPQFTERD